VGLSISPDSEWAILDLQVWMIARLRSAHFDIFGFAA
jgi:hypothetical protein